MSSVASLTCHMSSSCFVPSSQAVHSTTSADIPVERRPSAPAVLSRFSPATAHQRWLRWPLRSRPLGLSNHLQSSRVIPAECTATFSTAVGASNGVQCDVDQLFKTAVKAGNLRLCKELVAGGHVDVNRPSPERGGWTPLHLSAYYEHPEITRLLLENGAKTEVRNHSGNTALQFACLRGNMEVAELLLDRGADIHAQSDDEGTAIDYASEWGGEDMVNLLLLRSISQRMKSRHARVAD